MTLMKDTLGEVEAVVDLAKRWQAPVITAQTVMFHADSPDRSQAVTNREAQAALYGPRLTRPRGGSGNRLRPAVQRFCDAGP